MNEQGRAAVFLDRDGVLNRAVMRNGQPYPPRSLAELEVMPGAEQALGRLRAAGFLLLVVTNQPDVARGILQREVVEAINNALASRLPLDEIFTCYEDGDVPQRKPNPGMLLDAAAKYGVDLDRSFMVGDRSKDVEAGRRAGCRTVLIDHGYQETRRDVVATFTTPNVIAAADWILTQAQAARWHAEAFTPAGDCTQALLRGLMAPVRRTER